MTPTNVTIEFSRDVQRVQVQSAPDPSWRFTDAAGHEHHYGEHFTLPTLRWHSRPGVYEDGEPADFGWWECTICTERVTPGRYTPPPQMIPGPASVYGEFDTTDPISVGETFSLSVLNSSLVGEGIVTDLYFMRKPIRAKFESTGAVSFHE